jgi:hypothetical protein
MRAKKHVATTMTAVSGEIFLVKCQKQAFSFNKREAKREVYCYAFLHVLKRDTCIKHDKTFKQIFFYLKKTFHACRHDTLKCPG